MKSADDKAAKFGHEAHEAAVVAVFNRLDHYFDGTPESVAIEEELCRLMRLPARPATAPGDWVARAKALMANSDYDCMTFTVLMQLKALVRDLAKAEPVAVRVPELLGDGAAEQALWSAMNRAAQYANRDDDKVILAELRKVGIHLATTASVPAPEAKASAGLLAEGVVDPTWMRGKPDSPEVIDLKQQLAAAKADTDTQRTLTQVAHDDRDEWMHCSREWRVRAEKAEAHYADERSARSFDLARLAKAEASGDAKLRAYRDWLTCKTHYEPGHVREIDRLLAETDGGAD